MQRAIGVLIYIGCIGIGSFTNAALISLGYTLIPPPEGFNMAHPVEFQNAIAHIHAKHFIFPFLAHGFGTFCSAWLWCSIKRKATWKATLGIAAVFFSGGLYMAFILDAPIIFEALDLCYAYFPMGLLGYSLRLKTTQCV